MVHTYSILTDQPFITPFLNPKQNILKKSDWTWEELDETVVLHTVDVGLGISQQVPNMKEKRLTMLVYKPYILMYYFI